MKLTLPRAGDIWGVPRDGWYFKYTIEAVTAAGVNVLLQGNKREKFYWNEFRKYLLKYGDKLISRKS